MSCWEKEWLFNGCWLLGLKLWCNVFVNFVLSYWREKCNQLFPVFWKNKNAVRFSIVTIVTKVLFIFVNIQALSSEVRKILKQFLMLLYYIITCILFTQTKCIFYTGVWMFFRCLHVIIQGLSKASTVPTVRTKRRNWRHSQTSSSRSVPRWTSTQGSDTRSKPKQI